MTKVLYEGSQKKWWGRAYLQNHCATNYVALLTSGIMLRAHGIPGAKDYIKKSMTSLEANMRLLTLIKDGSLNEGVGYVGYTVRSFSQYVHLAERHLNINHRDNPWFVEHFNYIYYTILPGLGKNIGLADSPATWFYGPESQLVFLDSFFLKNGWGNWLASEIRKNRADAQNRVASQRYVTLHTEYIWFNASIPATPPPNFDDSALHHFSDIGLVTYRNGGLGNRQSTFFSLKAGKLHGEAVYDLIYGYDSVNDKPNGWYMFNPGHEHPDQSAFTFYPRGVPVVTDNMYSPKFSHLENVIMFAPYNLSACQQPWAGQLGGCKRFLTWKNGDEKTNHGEILFRDVTSDGIVTTVAESTHAYTSKLGLESVIRATVLLPEDVLVVVDSISLKRESELQLASSYFNNRELKFVTWRSENDNDVINGVTINETQSSYAKDPIIFWLTDEGRSPVANVTTVQYSSVGGVNKGISNVNVTYPLHRKQTSLVSVLIGSSADVYDVTVQYTNLEYVITVQSAERTTTVHLPCLKKAKQFNNDAIQLTQVTHKPSELGAPRTHQHSFTIPSVARFRPDESVTSQPSWVKQIQLSDKRSRNLRNTLEKRDSDYQDMSAFRYETLESRAISPSVGAPLYLLFVVFLVLIIFKRFFFKRLRYSNMFCIRLCLRKLPCFRSS